MARSARGWRARSLTAARLGLEAALALVLALGLAAALVSQLLGRTGHGLVVIAGGSMTPALPLGSLVVVEPVSDPATLRAGDVVTIRTEPDRAPVTHRIVRVVQHDGSVWLELRGDANAAADPVIFPASAVLGRAVLAWPELGRWLTILGSAGGLRLVLGLAATLYLLAVLLDELARRAGRRRALVVVGDVRLESPIRLVAQPARPVVVVDGIRPVTLR